MNNKHQDGPFTATDGTACPSPDALLRYADHKLPRRRAGEVRAHMESCGCCAELTGLMGSPADLPAVERKKDRELVARRLGFAGKKSLLGRLLELSDRLWEVRAPILVPVSITALLLFILLPAAPPVTRKDATPLVYHYTEMSLMFSSDLILRSGQGVDHQATAGSLIILQHHSSQADLAAGDPVSLTISGGPARERILLATVSGDGLIEVPLVFPRPGRYQIRISRRDSDENLADLQCTITAPSTPETCPNN